MFQLKQYNYILLLSFFLLQQSICSACNVVFLVDKISPTCHGDTDGKITIEVTDGTAPFVYSFDGGTTFSTENFFRNLTTGYYDIVVQDAEGCDNSETVFLSEPDLLMVELGEDIAVNLGNTIELSAQIIGSFDNISWSSTDFDNPFPPDLDSYEITYSPINSHIVYVYVENGNCIVSNSFSVTVEKPDDIFIPNVFTPNGDGFNDFFNIYPGISVAKINKFQVLNNWGGIVFEAFDFYPFNETLGWDGIFDGQAMSNNIFVYCVEIEYIDGETKIFCGDVLLMRYF